AGAWDAVRAVIPNRPFGLAEATVDDRQPQERRRRGRSELERAAELGLGLAQPPGADVEGSEVERRQVGARLGRCHAAEQAVFVAPVAVAQPREADGAGREADRQGSRDAAPDGWAAPRRVPEQGP